MKDSLAVYVHWPYCLSKCPYCDFNSQVLTGGVDQKEWRKAYILELGGYARILPGREIGSVYFGGGTPSLMEPGTVAAVLDKIAGLWRLAGDCEITIEANPSSSEAEKFTAFRKAGVNRVSLGVQSLRDDALRFLGRAHDADEARRAIEISARIFPRFSFDLIYGRNNQTLEMWAAELREALTFEPEHLSLYQLTIEPGTRFALLAEERPMTAPEDDAAAMQDVAVDISRSSGLHRYEISNYAVPGGESRHNLAYWRYDDYLGIGPGAHGRLVLDGERHATENAAAPEEWLLMVKEQGHGRIANEILDIETAQREALIMGLRLTAGIDCAEWRKKFGMELFDFLPEARVRKLWAEGLVLLEDGKFRATPKGLQKLNGILEYLTR